jgi:hypothetical protein
MKLLFALLSFVSLFSIVHASIFSEDFEGVPTIPATWTVFSVDSDTSGTWYPDDFSGDNFAEVNAFGDSAAANDWLITPSIFIPSTAVNPYLTFQNTSSFSDSGQSNPITVLWSTTYSGSGDPTGLFTAFTDSITYSSGGYSEVTSGNIDLSALTGQNIYIGFQYLSSGTGPGTSSLWQLDDVEVIPEPTTLLTVVFFGFGLMLHRIRAKRNS